MRIDSERWVLTLIPLLAMKACEGGVDDLTGWKRDLGNETAYLLEAS